jgi:hypothetical protein
VIFLHLLLSLLCSIFLLRLMLDDIRAQDQQEDERRLTRIATANAPALEALRSAIASSGVLLRDPAAKSAANDRVVFTKKGRRARCVVRVFGGTVQRPDGAER